MTIKLRNHNLRVEEKYWVPLSSDNQQEWAKKVAYGLMAAFCGKSQVTSSLVAQAYCGHVRNGSFSDLGHPDQAIQSVCEHLAFDNETDEDFAKESTSLAKELLLQTDMEVPGWLYDWAKSS